MEVEDDAGGEDDADNDVEDKPVGKKPHVPQYAAKAMKLTCAFCEGCFRCKAGDELHGQNDVSLCPHCIDFATDCSMGVGDLISVAKGAKTKKTTLKGHRDAWEAGKKRGAAAMEKELPDDTVFEDTFQIAVLKETFDVMTNDTFKDVYKDDMGTYKLSTVRAEKSNNEVLKGLLVSSGADPQMEVQTGKMVVHRRKILDKPGMVFKDQCQVVYGTKALKLGKTFGLKSGTKYTPKFKRLTTYTKKSLAEFVQRAKKPKTPKKDQCSTLDRMLRNEAKVAVSDSDEDGAAEDEENDNEDEMGGEDEPANALQVVTAIPCAKEEADPAVAALGAHLTPDRGPAKLGKNSPGRGIGSCKAEISSNRRGRGKSKAAASSRENSGDARSRSPVDKILGGVQQNQQAVLAPKDEVALALKGDADGESESEAEETSGRVKPPAHWFKVLSIRKVWKGNTFKNRLKYAKSCVKREAGKGDTITAGRLQRHIDAIEAAIRVEDALKDPLITFKAMLPLIAALEAALHGPGHGDDDDTWDDLIRKKLISKRLKSSLNGIADLGVQVIAEGSWPG